MTLRKVKGNFDRIFDKNLSDLVRGIRNNKENESKYISQCIEEIKEELKQDNISVKANAVSKLTYLEMLGFDISWSAFNIIEVMSSTKFTYKRIGYLASSQSFHENTEVMMLTTNMIRKDLNSQNMYDAGCAMSGLSCFVSTDISRDLANDVLTLLTSTKPYLRKKAVLLMYKIFLKFPEALKPAFPRLKEKLEDPDPGVQSAAVNVICELARKNPKNYLSLAPVFFKLMTNSTNNWMLIKIIKLFGALTPLEPRLGKKLIEPLTNLIHSTSAMSLLYECINTVIAVLISISSGLPNHNASIQLCVQKLRILIEDSDQNLKYLGLLAMSKILKTHPKSVQAHKDLVLTCLDDKDESIRLRALDLLYGMVTKKNLIEIVQKLIANVTESQMGNKYRDELISKLIDICSQNDYQFVANFEWYVTVLVELSRVEGGTEHGGLIAQQLLDVAIRVEAIRPFVTKQMAILLENSHLFLNNSSVSEVLYASAWICGEFADYIPDETSTLKHLLTTTAFPPHITSVFIQNASKILSKMSKEKNDEFYRLCDELVDKHLPYFMTNEDLEVQERATSLLQIIEIIRNEDINLEQLFYAYPLNPVAAKAQRKVPIPVGLDIELPFVEFDDSDSDDERLEEMAFVKDNERESQEVERPLTEQEIKKYKLMAEARKAENENNPNYLKSRSKKKKKIPKVETDIEVAEEVLSEQVMDGVIAKNTIPGLLSSENFLKKAKHKKTKKSRQKQISVEEEEEETEAQQQVTIKGLEMPEGVNINDFESDEESNENQSFSDPHRALAKVSLNETVNISSKQIETNISNRNEKKKSSSGKKGKSEEKKPKKSKTPKIESDENLLGDTNTEVIHKKIRRPKTLELNGEKKRSKKKIKSKVTHVLDEETDLSRKRDEYEETVGIETPSQLSQFVPSITPSQTPTPSS